MRRWNVQHTTAIFVVDFLLPAVDTVDSSRHPSIQASSRALKIFITAPPEKNYLKETIRTVDHSPKDHRGQSANRHGFETIFCVATHISSFKTVSWLSTQRASLVATPSPQVVEHCAIRIFWWRNKYSSNKNHSLLLLQSNHQISTLCIFVRYTCDDRSYRLRYKNLCPLLCY